MMAPIVGLVLIICACMSVSGEEYPIENCPNAKYKIEDISVLNVLIECWTQDIDVCVLYVREKEKTIKAKFDFIAEEDISVVYYNVSLVGNNNINAGSSGEVKPYVIENRSRVDKTVPKNTTAYVDFETNVEGNMTKGEGNATVQLYFNEPMKDTPDICVTTKLILIDH